MVRPWTGLSIHLASCDSECHSLRNRGNRVGFPWQELEEEERNRGNRVGFSWQELEEEEGEKP